MNADDVDAQMLQYAARIALRGHGRAEPNPCVGCVVLDHEGTIVGTGFHAHCGQAHAERNALAMAGDRARGGTVYITLEPCAHEGRTPPCTEALQDAGVARVLIGARDPNHLAAGGLEVLERCGIEVAIREDVDAVRHLNAPFLHRLKTNRPWVLAKWAQTLDGAIATTSGDSKWISSPQSRRMVHRERGRVDAILTGIGTVIADDPKLNARDVSVRRRATRVVVDPNLDIPIDSTLVGTANEIPLIVACDSSKIDSGTGSRLQAMGVKLLPMTEPDGLETLLKRLASEYEISTVMVEAGGGLLGQLLKANLVNAALVFIAPRLIGDALAPSAARGLAPERIADSIALETIWSGRRGDDLVGWYHLS